MGYPVNWFQIQGQDQKTLQSFYKKVFSWRMQPSPDGSPMAMVSSETGGIPGGIAATMDGSPKGVSVYVGVDDIKGHLKKIEKAGGKKVMDVMELPQGMGFIAGFVDPAGNWIGLWQGAKAEKQARAKTAAKPAARAASKTAKAAPKGKAKRAPKRGGKGKRGR